MSLSRRGFLFALGLALPATTLLSEEAEAAESARNRRRRLAKQAHANAKPRNVRSGKAHAASRRRRHTTT